MPTVPTTRKEGGAGRGREEPPGLHLKRREKYDRPGQRWALPGFPNSARTIVSHGWRDVNEDWALDDVKEFVLLDVECALCAWSS